MPVHFMPEEMETRRQLLLAAMTSTIKRVRVWVDREGSSPVADLKDLLVEGGLAGLRVGVEWDTHGLVAHHGMRLAVSLDGFVTATDASRLIAKLRLSSPRPSWPTCAAPPSSPTPRWRLRSRTPARVPTRR